jgi:hypothetical protein
MMRLSPQALADKRSCVVAEVSQLLFKMIQIALVRRAARE